MSSNSRLPAAIPAPFYLLGIVVLSIVMISMISIIKASSLCFRLETAIPLLQHALHNLPDHDNLMYAFPDDGAYKRFHLMFSDDESKLIICSKKRVEGGKRIVTVKDGMRKKNFRRFNPKTLKPKITCFRKAKNSQIFSY